MIFANISIILKKTIMELGKNTNYSMVYNSDILDPITRITLSNSYGYDIWTCYELSWLNIKGKPEVAILTLYIPNTSVFIIESKSLKLYLNSFNNKKISSIQELKDIIKADLEKCCDSKIDLVVDSIEEFSQKTEPQFTGTNIDNLDVECNDYNKEKNSLKTLDNACEEELYTHLFRSHCPVTNQPDYASIYVQYKASKQINHESLLQYLVSFRNHPSFHEKCIEEIFADLYDILKPELLTIYGRFLRRGGIDINPVRSTKQITSDVILNYPMMRQ